MKSLLPKTSTIVTGLAVIVLLGGAYFFFLQGSPTDTALSQTSVAGNAAQQKFAALVTQLTPINFDTRVFSDPRFKALTDITTVITPEAAGRPDPFAAFPGAPSVTAGQ